MNNNQICQRIESEFPNSKINLACNELHLELMGINGYNPLLMYVSSARNVMVGTQMSQRAVTAGCDQMLQTSGMDLRLADSTAAVRMPENGKVLQIIPRIPDTAISGVEFNPETYVLFEAENGVLDYFVIPHHKSFDPNFGFRYVMNEDNINSIQVHQSLPKDMVFADSPAVKDGFFNVGINANVAFATDLETAEDGFVISESFIKSPKLKFHMYQKVVVEYGSRTYPLLNEQGKIHPDIGEYIGKNALLMTLRKYSKHTAPVDCSIHDLREPNYQFDEPVFVQNNFPGRIVDIVVVKNNLSPEPPDVLCQQTEKYCQFYVNFNRALVDFETRMYSVQRKMYGARVNLPLSEKLHNLLVTAHGITHRDRDPNAKIGFMFKKEPIDSYRCEFTIEYEIQPWKGNKFTDICGGKGVCVDIRPDEHMPVDSQGNRADIIIDAGSRFARMIPGSLYAHALGGLTRDIAMHHIRPATGFVEGMTEETFRMQMTAQKYEVAIGKLFTLFRLVSDHQYNFYKEQPEEELIGELYDICVEKQIRIDRQINGKVDLSVTMPILRDIFKPVLGPVRFYNRFTGQYNMTTKPVLIAPLLIMVLDKVGGELMATATANVHAFGILAQVNKGNRSRYPWRNTPAKVVGETEFRLYLAYCGRRVVAELYDFSNSIESQKAVVWKISESDKPTSIPVMIDRSEIKYGNTKGLQYFKHMMGCRGISVEWNREK